MKRRTTTGGGSLLVWRFAFSALGDQHTSSMTCGLGPSCHKLGCFGARRAGFSAASRGASGESALKRDSPRVQQLHFRIISQLMRPFASELSAPLCIRALWLSATVVAMASLVHPEHFQSEGALNLVHNLLGWSAPAFAGRIRVGATPLGDLTAREFVLFVSYLSCGLALPISPFFLLLLLEELGLQLQHLMPHSILQAAIFAHLCKMFVGVALFCQCSEERMLRSDLPEMESELSCDSTLCMNPIASRSSLISSSLNFTHISWYASMNWSSSGSAAAARPPSATAPPPPALSPSASPTPRWCPHLVSLEVGNEERVVVWVRDGLGLDGLDVASVGRQ
jgi:hypothetical protein